MGAGASAANGAEVEKAMAGLLRNPTDRNGGRKGESKKPCAAGWRTRDRKSISRTNNYFIISRARITSLHSPSTVIATPIPSTKFEIMVMWATPTFIQVK